MSGFFAAVRKVLFWLHLAIGVAGGVIILVMSVTGVMLGFERQIRVAIDGAPQVEVPAVQEPMDARLRLDALLQSASVTGDDLSRITTYAAAEKPVELRFLDRERGTLLLNPYTADTVAPAERGAATEFLAATRRWHRWLGAQGGELRTQLRAVTGAANLGFLLLVLSGIWLWWPRSLRWSAIKQTLWFRRGLRPKARDFNWHNTIGFWTAVPLFLVVASGAFISYKWPDQWLDRALGSPEEQALARGESVPKTVGEASATPTERAPLSLQALALAEQAAREAHPEWQRLSLNLPSEREEMVQVAVAEGNTYRPDLRTTLTIDPATAAVVSSAGYASLSTSRKIRSWTRFGHTGEVFGIPGQIIATLASLGGVVLVWTGLALSFRRLLAWRLRRRSGAVATQPRFTPPGEMADA